MKGFVVMKSSISKSCVALVVALFCWSDLALSAEVKKVRATGQAVIYQNVSSSVVKLLKCLVLMKKENLILQVLL